MFKILIKSRFLLAILFLLSIICSPISCKKDKLPPPPVENQIPNGATPIPASTQRNGDAAEGYNYLVSGDYIKSGIPFNIFIGFYGTDSANDLGRSGDNANINYQFTAVNAPNGVRIVAPNCLQCHAQKLNGELIVGLGNSFYDSTVDQGAPAGLLSLGIDGLYGPNSPEKEASAIFLKVVETIGPHLITAVKGVNTADKLAAVLAAHRNPIDLTWNDTPQLPIPIEVVPSDVPAFWLLKKKNAMFYTGLGRQDFARFMMASNMLTVTDSSEAREVDEHFDDVLAYILSIEAPPYPENVDWNLANEGATIFNNHCQTCHGKYGAEESYPNYLIATEVIGTDPLLAKSNILYDDFVNWYNTSWFSQNPYAAHLIPGDGYIAAPLDGVWATAPYLHNGSVPTLEDLLNSSQRPTYWKRSFNDNDYDFTKVGWNYTIENQGGNSDIYDTTLPGYGNQGHTYGDVLTATERSSLIEYLKTL